MINKNFQRRKIRVRSKVFGTGKRPRLVLFRSNKNLYAQIIDDEKMTTLVGLSGKKIKTKEMKNIQVAEKLGEEISVLAQKAKIKSVVFDKSGYKYHGRVKAFAESARKGGLEF